MSTINNIGGIPQVRYTKPVFYEFMGKLGKMYNGFGFVNAFSTNAAGDPSLVNRNTLPNVADAKCKFVTSTGTLDVYATKNNPTEITRVQSLCTLYGVTYNAV